VAKPYVKGKARTKLGVQILPKEIITERSLAADTC
jgi:hypothetical protein